MISFTPVTTTQDPDDDEDDDDEPQVRREASRRRVNNSAKGSPPKVRFQGQREQPDPRRQLARDRGTRARDRTRTSAEAMDDPEDDSQVCCSVDKHRPTHASCGS